MSRKSHKKQTYDRGKLAEHIAALWLWVKGYKILARRYKTTVGEVDLIALKGDVIAFIEVKARPTTTQGLESITPKARERIIRTAEHFMTQGVKKAKLSPEKLTMRFDLITVTPPFFIHHLDNAWQANA